jgi:hypothetical protein
VEPIRNIMSAKRVKNIWKIVYMTPEQQVVNDEIYKYFLGIYHLRKLLLEKYELEHNENFRSTMTRKASLIAVSEITWESAIDSTVKSLERTFTIRLLYILDSQDRKDFIDEAYDLISKVHNLKSQKPAILDNLPPPFRIKLQPEPPNDSGSEE